MTASLPARLSGVPGQGRPSPPEPAHDTADIAAPEAALTEIPEHLLKRAAAARAAKSGEAPPADTPAEATAATTPAEAPVVAAPAPVVVAAPEPVAPYIAAHHARPKVPWWAASALLLLPLWAFTYVGTLERPPQEATGVLAEGAHVYEARCASCHGATGAGGSGHALADGEVSRRCALSSDRRSDSF